MVRLSHRQRDLIEHLLCGEQIDCCPRLQWVSLKPYTFKDVYFLARKGLVTVEPKDKSIPPPPSGGFYPDVFEQEVVLTRKFLQIISGDRKTKVIDNATQAEAQT